MRRFDRLRLAGSPPPVAVLVASTLLVWALASAIVVSFALSIELPGGVELVRIEQPGVEGPVVAEIPRVIVWTTYPGLALAAAALVVAAHRRRERWSPLVPVFVGLVGAALAAKTVEAADLATIYRELIRGRELLPAATPPSVRVLGWVGIAAAALTAVLPSRLARRWPLPSGLLAAAPFLLSFAAYLVLDVTRDYPPALEGKVFPPEAAALGALVALVAGIGFWLAVLGFWLVVAGARAARDAGAAFRRVAAQWPWLLAALLAAKVAWLGAGYLDVLPDVLGGDADSWEYSREDGLLSWAMALGFATAVALWVRRRRPPEVSEREITWTAAGIVLAFSICLLLAATALLIVSVLGVAPGSGAQSAARDSGLWFADRLLGVQIAAVYAAGVVGVALLWSGRARAIGFFLLLFALLGLPRALDITIHWGDATDFPGRIELATLDAAVTASVAILALALLRRRDPTIHRERLVVVLVASTLVTYAGVLVSSNLDDGAFYFGLVFPAAYLFLFEARALNQPGPERDRRRLEATAVAAVLTVIAVLQISTGYAGPDRPTLAELGRVLLQPALVAMLVAAAAFRLEERTSY